MLDVVGDGPSDDVAANRGELPPESRGGERGLTLLLLPDQQAQLSIKEKCFFLSFL